MAESINLSIDARLAGPSHAGIGRYEAEIISRLVQRRSLKTASGSRPVQWHVWVKTDGAVEWLPADLPNVTLHRTSVRHYTVAEQTIWPSQLGQVPSDLLWVPHFNVPLRSPFPWVVTIHDLLWHQEKDARATTLPAWQHAVKHWAYRWITQHAVRQADAILVPSHAVQQEVEREFGSDLSISVTPEGVNAHFLRAELPRRVKTDRPEILYVGSLYPHKNLKVVLRALRALPEFRLVVASARSVFTADFEAEAQRIGVGHQVEILGYVSDADLISRAARTLALIQPSTSEGFGLTGLEGLAMGMPVVASDLPVFQEVYGDHARYFPSHDANQLVQILQSLQENFPAQSVRKAGQDHARQFTWDKTADLTWDTLQTAWRKRYDHA